MINFSAIIVTYNEDAHLEECLNALNFCQEKIVIDLGSTDESIAIAEKYNCKVIKHEHVAIVEQIRAWAINQAKNDWIIFMDPDEIFPTDDLKEIYNLIENEKVDGITFPRINYFIGDKIEHGRWYGTTGFPRLFHKNSVVLSDSVHDGLKRKTTAKYIKSNGIIKHYWIDSMDQFYEKHERYLKFEGESRYKRGQRFSYTKMYISICFNIFDWYVLNHGFLDKKNGWKLIKLALWYEKNAWLSLKEYQNKQIIT